MLRIIISYDMTIYKYVFACCLWWLFMMILFLHLVILWLYVNSAIKVFLQYLNFFNFGNLGFFIFRQVGLRQVGVLPAFFHIFCSLYMWTLYLICLNPQNRLLYKLECFNSFMYADDLILLTSSVTDMQNSLSLCVSAFTNLDLSININKNHCLRVGPRFNANCVNMTINGDPLKWVQSTRYLGITFCNSPVFSLNMIGVIPSVNFPAVLILFLEG